MKKGYLSQYFEGVAFKTLSAVEADIFRSHQHEFNGVTDLRAVLGEPTGKVRFSARFLYMTDMDEPIADDGFLTWYDARQKARLERQVNRYEYRLYFSETHVLQLANPEDFLFVAKQVNTNKILVIVAEKDNKILFVKQFRYATKQALFELPAGKLDKMGEDILSAAKRELEEETGHCAQTWENLGYIWTSPGFCTEKLYLFKATNLTFIGQHLDEGEILDYFSIEKEEVFNMIKNGEINDSKTICALMRAYKV